VRATAGTQVERTHVGLYLRWFECQVGSINTVCHGLGVLASFYRWLVQSGLADTTPIAAVRRPSRDETPRQTRLRHELADWLNTAETAGGAVYAMARRGRTKARSRRWRPATRAGVGT
jgi:site-specific recombinase XerD